MLLPSTSIATDWLMVILGVSLIYIFKISRKDKHFYENEYTSTGGKGLPGNDV
jgi:hypothetical protein